MKFCQTLINLLARHFVSEDNNQVKEITMIFDDLKNISFYKGIHPNLDKLQIISMSIVRILLNQVNTILMGIRSFQLYRKMFSTKKKMIALSIIKTMQICICQLKDMSILATVLASKMRLQPLMKPVILAFVHCHEQYPLFVGISQFCSFLPRRTSST